MKDYNDIYMTPGAFSWNELSSPDPQAARDFYGRLFGWVFDTMNLGDGDYHVIKVGEAAVGGVMKQQQPGPAMWGAYVTWLPAMRRWSRPRAWAPSSAPAPSTFPP